MVMLRKRLHSEDVATVGHISVWSHESHPEARNIVSLRKTQDPAKVENARPPGRTGDVGVVSEVLHAGVSAGYPLHWAVDLKRSGLPTLEVWAENADLSQRRLEAGEESRVGCKR